MYFYLLTNGVIKDIKSSHIKDCLNQFDLIENEDYQVSNVGQQDIQHGGSN